MATVIEMPKLSDTMSVGTLVNWLKNEGEKVEVGDLIAEVETDKATMELEAFDEGILLKQVAKAGDQVPIGGPVAVVGEAGEEVDMSQFEAPAGVATPTEVKEAMASPAPVIAPIPVVAVSAAPVVTSSGRVKASPLAKKLAEQKGVNLSNITGTGPGGRICRADVEAAEQGGGSYAAPTLSGAPVANDEQIPLSNMRTIIAQRLLESKTQVPHFYLETEVDSAPLAKIRADLNSVLTKLPPEQGGIKLTVTDFILKATVEALRRVPAANASFGGTFIQQHGAVHLGVAVAVDEGLVVPVIKDAHLKGVRQLSADLKELAGKAKNKKLSPDEMSGSTFTVSSLGMFGITGFFGIINMPNAGILSIGASVKQPVVDANNNIVIGERMTVGGSFDHRVVDGAVAAMFLKALREILEAPSLLLL